MSYLEQFDFKGRQLQAATDPAGAIVVTAGAGSGKTLSLVGRYLYLLEQGHPLRSILAITFTDKAAREMRSRVRLALESSPLPAPGAGEESGGIESLRIGTIHSLCAELLRAHPAEAALDPAFAVLEEGLSAAYKVESIDDALAWVAAEPEAATLFGLFKENELRAVLSSLLEHRLDIAPFESPAEAGAAEQERVPVERAWVEALSAYLSTHLSCPEWKGALVDLASRRSLRPEDRLELARVEVLARWGEAQQALARSEWSAALAGLAALRKATSTQGRKENWAPVDLEAARQDMAELRQVYDGQLKTLAEKCRWTLDEQLAAALPAIRRLFARVLEAYWERKEARQALDFDDLELHAARLLVDYPQVRRRWQSEIGAVLVDEFQDTNQRQRQIVYALTGFSSRPQAESTAGAPGEQKAGSLFIVGDSKQSIYRFRGADVSVFRQVQADIQSAGGLALDLDLTFRAHKPLLDGLNALLAPILGQAADGAAARSYNVPFAPLNAYRLTPASGRIRPPFIEFQLGCGEDAEAGRAAASRALAGRLQDMHEDGEFEWGEVALLFRSSTAFGAYETALESAAIPFVTVAGRGFYDRPEIRDLLNSLAAIADPGDDLALAGLLRSPALALADAELYRLRFPPDGGDRPRRLWESLQSSPVPSHARAAEILAELNRMAGRLPAAAVLKRFLDLTGYRTLLNAAPDGSRMARNVDKLLSDAHRSRLVSLGEFLKYVQTLRDMGLREGEAPVDAGGAVQLMTVHKSKGLQFPLVVLADAAHEHRGGASKVLLDERLGLLLDLRSEEFHPVSWQLANLIEAEKDEAEDRRLLYVAATRAKEKLIASGHVKVKKDGTLSLGGWLGRLGAVTGLDTVPVDPQGQDPLSLEIRLPDAGEIACWLYRTAGQAPAPLPPRPQAFSVSVEPGDLVPPVRVRPAEQVDDNARARETDPPRRVWRVVPRAKRPVGPAWVVGRLVHQALQRWRFPDEGFDDFLYPFALELGLTNPAEIRATLRAVGRLLERLRTHPFYAEVEAAEGYHAVPYALPGDRGVIDLLYRTAGGWFVVDFLSDRVDSEVEARQALTEKGYGRQAQRYAEAVAALLGQRPRAQVVFLQAGREVKVFEV
jgi:ATP-dependent helicase/nuclease subunit A